MSDAFPERPPPWRRYLRFWRRDAAGDTDEEFRLHLETRAEELIAQGHTPASASERALAEFGDLQAVRTELHEIDRRIDRRLLRAEWLASWADDLRYAARSLTRSPGLVAMVVLAMSLGLGANAAMFSLLDELFIRPPAGVAGASSLRRLWFERFHGPTAPWTTQSVSYPEFLDAARAAQPDAEVALDREDYAHIGRGAAAHEGWISHVSTNYFAVLGARIARGRSFSDAENRPGTPVPVAVLSAAFAQRWFGPEVDPLGRQLVVDGKSVTVIGVAAQGFAGHNLSAVDMWLPVAATVWNAPPWWHDGPGLNLRFSMVARLRPGADEGALQTRITTALRPHERLYYGGDTALVAMTGAINEAPAPGVLPTNRHGFDENLAIAPRLAAVALLVLCIACANVLNLLLARAVQRRREIAVRLALGISRARLVRLMVTESVALAMLGGAAAVLAAYWGGTVLRELVFPRVRWADGVLHWRVVAFSALAALAAGVVTGILPALRASNPALTAALKSGGRDGSPHGSRIRASLVAAQAALAVVLLVAASLLVSSLRNVEGIAIGYDAPRLLFARMSFDPDASPPSAVTGAAYRRLADDLARFPGVESVALSAFAPMRGSRGVHVFVGGDSNPPSLSGAEIPRTNAVSASYFRTVGLRFRAGSSFQEVGAGQAPTTAIVNETMARLAWPGLNAVGQCIRFGSRTSSCLTVIGVTEDGHRGRVIEPTGSQVFLPLSSLGWEDPAVVVVRADPARIPAIIAEATIRLRSLLPAGYPFIERMLDGLDVDYRPFRLAAVLFTAFGALALLVAIVGIYSAVAYGVRQRKHEFGVRIALGARLRDVLRLVIGGELRVVGIGVLVGLGLSLSGGRFVASLLYGVSPRDPFAMGFVTVVLLAAVVVASVGPAWRAGKADPARVLRED